MPVNVKTPLLASKLWDKPLDPRVALSKSPDSKVAEEILIRAEVSVVLSMSLMLSAGITATAPPFSVKVTLAADKATMGASLVAKMFTVAEDAFELSVLKTGSTTA